MQQRLNRENSRKEGGGVYYSEDTLAELKVRVAAINQQIDRYNKEEITLTAE